LHSMQAYGSVEDPLAGFCGDSDVPLYFIRRKHVYEQMKARQDVPVNEMARLGIDILASLRSTYHIAWTLIMKIAPVGVRDFFSKMSRLALGPA